MALRMQSKPFSYMENNVTISSPQNTENNENTQTRNGQATIKQNQPTTTTTTRGGLHPRSNLATSSPKKNINMVVNFEEICQELTEARRQAKQHKQETIQLQGSLQETQAQNQAMTKFFVKFGLLLRAGITTYKRQGEDLEKARNQLDRTKQQLEQSSRICGQLVIAKQELADRVDETHRQMLLLKQLYVEHIVGALLPSQHLDSDQSLVTSSSGEFLTKILSELESLHVEQWKTEIPRFLEMQGHLPGSLGSLKEEPQVDAPPPAEQNMLREQFKEEMRLLREENQALKQQLFEQQIVNDTQTESQKKNNQLTKPSSSPSPFFFSPSFLLVSLSTSSILCWFAFRNFK